jgi:hypothetical protein
MTLPFIANSLNSDPKLMATPYCRDAKRQRRL